MTSLLNLLLLPLRAPMVLVLLVISTYLGLHWSRPGSWADAGAGGITDLIWSAECLQAVVVVVVCTMPDLLLRRLSALMAASRVASLVITLLLVITGGLYLLHLDVLSNVLILASTVLLARLDLVRLRVVPPPFVMTVILSVLVLGGITLGRGIEASVHPEDPVPQESRAPTGRPAPREPAPQTREAGPAPSGGDPRQGDGRVEKGDAAGSGAASPAPSPAERPDTGGSDAGGGQGPETREAGGPVVGSGRQSTPVTSPAAGSRGTPKPGHGNADRAPDRALPHLQGSAPTPEMP